MFVIELTYIVPIEDIDLHIIEHREVLKQAIDNDILLLSGKKDPRNGGFIITLHKNIDDVYDWIKLDPFYKHNLAEYRISKFEPTKYRKEISSLLEKGV